jgi:hypothetical protein
MKRMDWQLAHAMNCALNLGIMPLNKRTIRQAITNGRLHPNKIRNYGKRLHARMCEHVGLLPNAPREGQAP